MSPSSWSSPPSRVRSAAAVLWSGRPGRWLGLATAANLAVAAVWAFSRTTGIAVDGSAAAGGHRIQGLHHDPARDRRDGRSGLLVASARGLAPRASGVRGDWPRRCWARGSGPSARRASSPATPTAPVTATRVHIPTPPMPMAPSRSPPGSNQRRGAHPRRRRSRRRLHLSGRHGGSFDAGPRSRPRRRNGDLGPRRHWSPPRTRRAAGGQPTGRRPTRAREPRPPPPHASRSASGRRGAPRPPRRPDRRRPRPRRGTFPRSQLRRRSPPRRPRPQAGRPQAGRPQNRTTPNRTTRTTAAAPRRWRTF